MTPLVISHRSWDLLFYLISVAKLDDNHVMSKLTYTFLIERCMAYPDTRWQYAKQFALDYVRVIDNRSAKGSPITTTAPAEDNTATSAAPATSPALPDGDGVRSEQGKRYYMSTGLLASTLKATLFGAMQCSSGSTNSIGKRRFAVEVLHTWNEIQNAINESSRLLDKAVVGAPVASSTATRSSADDEVDLLFPEKMDRESLKYVGLAVSSCL